MHELSNQKVSLTFDAGGRLARIENRLTGERYVVSGDEFEVEATDFRFAQAEAQFEGLDCWDGTLEARYRYGPVRVEVTYRLKGDQAFATKQVTLTAYRDWGLVRVELGRPTFAGEGLHFVTYAHPVFDLLEAQHGGKIRRPPDSEPSRTFFGRTSKGGLMVGVAMPYDASERADGCITLAIAPNLKLQAGQSLALEPAYFGVYRRGERDERAAEWRPHVGLYVHHGDIEKAQADGPLAGIDSGGIRPLPSESRAMVALATVVLGPRRAKGLVAAACGWHCQLEQREYSEESAEADMRALEFMAACGVNWLTESHPWSGETAQMNGLREGDIYTPGPLVRRVLEHARRLGVRVVNWPSMNNSHPWSSEGRPFREDRQDWLRVPAPEWQDESATQRDIWSGKFRALQYNCIANTPFWNWVTRVNLQALATSLWDGWCMDGDFWGTGAYYQTVVPVDCHAANHDHLPGDANYACQRALEAWKELVLAHYPDTVIGVCRPPMDLGVWAQRNTDLCFTLIESGTTNNIAGGNEIRLSSRVRVHEQFMPHTIDWPLLFPSYANEPVPFPAEHIDFIMLSALSSAPNLLLYLPARDGLPEPVIAEIRRWLDWGREHIDFLQVRHDLFDWPQPGKVDGSAHLLGDRGLILLFNPNQEPLEGAFALTDEDIGLTAEGDFALWQEYPAGGERIRAHSGQTVRWAVPGETAIVLRLAPA
ncbi:MAG: hypothetical protein GX601_01765 [Anaerolineales bacterium]|nr:hypothetical protein [Anaerolineales bacterium]